MTSLTPAAGKAIRTGSTAPGNDSGFVNVGTDHDTAQFADGIGPPLVGGPRQDRHPHAARLLVTCDAGGSNGYRPRAWKVGTGQARAGDRAGRSMILPLPARHPMPLLELLK